MASAGSMTCWRWLCSTPRRSPGGTPWTLARTISAVVGPFHWIASTQVASTPRPGLTVESSSSASPAAPAPPAASFAGPPTAEGSSDVGGSSAAPRASPAPPASLSPTAALFPAPPATNFPRESRATLDAETTSAGKTPLLTRPPAPLWTGCCCPSMIALFIGSCPDSAILSSGIAWY